MIDHPINQKSSFFYNLKFLKKKKMKNEIPNQENQSPFFNEIIKKNSGNIQELLKNQNFRKKNKL